jgi:hypothetical protein
MIVFLCLGIVITTRQLSNIAWIGDSISKIFVAVDLIDVNRFLKTSTREQCVRTKILIFTAYTPLNERMIAAHNALGALNAR